MENNKKINEIYIDFYRFVDKIIYKIHNSEINKFLFYCEYLEIENGNLNYLPLTFWACVLGRMDYDLPLTCWVCVLGRIYNYLPLTCWACVLGRR